jgi:hypothetical protein
MRKCFILLLLSLIGIYMASGIKVSKRPSRINVSDLPIDGANCLVGKNLFCHRDIRFRFSRTTAKVCFNGTLTTMMVPSDYTTPERKNAECSCPCVSDLPVDGANCLVGKNLFCHRDIQFRFAPTTAKVCVNGTLTTMEVPSDYTTPERKSAECPCNPICKNKKGKLTYCNEDEVPPKPNRSTLKRQCLEDGKIYLISTVSGTKVPDGSYKN